MFLFYVLSFFKKGDTIQGGTFKEIRYSVMHEFGSKIHDLTPPFSFFCQRRRRKCIECVMILSNAKLLGPPGRLSNFMERHQHLWGEICQNLEKIPLCKQFDKFLQVPFAQFFKMHFILSIKIKEKEGAIFMCRSPRTNGPSSYLCF